MGRPKASRQGTVVGRSSRGHRNVGGYKGRKNRKGRKVMKPPQVIKGHKFAGHDDMALFGTAPAGGETNDPVEWFIFNPLMLNRIANSAPSDTDRQSNKIYARNTKHSIQIIPSKRCIHPFQVRICTGYFKGDDNKGTQGLVKNDLKVIYPDIASKLQTRQNAATADFYWKTQRTYTFTPRQIYDEDTEEGDHTGADRVLVASWRPRTIHVNFKYNRTHTYEGADGDSLNGWNPIIAVQVKPMAGHTDFTRPTLPSTGDTGANPCPRVQSSMTTYFSDIF